MERKLCSKEVIKFSCQRYATVVRSNSKIHIYTYSSKATTMFMYPRVTVNCQQNLTKQYFTYISYGQVHARDLVGKLYRDF